ncbi:hypothetical protein PRIC1_011898 [Phytophthora ramorum]
MVGVVVVPGVYRDTPNLLSVVDSSSVATINEQISLDETRERNRVMSSIIDEVRTLSGQGIRPECQLVPRQEVGSSASLICWTRLACPPRDASVLHVAAPEGLPE